MENKIEAVVRENVDTALEQADEFLKPPLPAKKLKSSRQKLKNAWLVQAET